MREQLRLRVLLPLAVLGLLGAGASAFAFGGTPADGEPIAVGNLAAAGKEDGAKARTKAKAGTKNERPAPRTPLERALARHRVVVVLLHTPGSEVDVLAASETRAGAAAARAGFLGVDVSDEDAVAQLATEHDLRNAPGILVVTRGPNIVTRLSGSVDRETVAQAAQNARA